VHYASRRVLCVARWCRVDINVACISLRLCGSPCTFFDVVPEGCAVPPRRVSAAAREKGAAVGKDPERVEARTLSDLYICGCGSLLHALENWLLPCACSRPSR
jgi:hypothetical protein